MKETLARCKTNKYSNSYSKIGTESNFTSGIIEENFANSFKYKQHLDLSHHFTNNKENSIFHKARFDYKGIKICKGNNYHISFKSNDKFVTYIDIPSYKNIDRNNSYELSGKSKSNSFSSSKNCCCITV